MRKEVFEEGEYYHVYNRGVDRRSVFSDDRDRIRFVHTLYLLNHFLTIPDRFDVISLEPRDLLTPIAPFVEIVAACLMPNHFHFMLTQKKKNGISAFLQKVGTSYTKHFNNRHERTGSLFEGTFKAKHVARHEYASYLTQYIHLNAATLAKGKVGGKDTASAIERYQWSTLPDYLDHRSPFSLFVTTRFRDEVLDVNAMQYRAFLHETLSSQA
ncbi:MAG: transposase [Patescibacteria group bacterium]